MEIDGSASAVALLGLDGFVVLAASVIDGELHQLVETTATVVGCSTCGVAASPHDRREVRVRDLPPVRLSDALQTTSRARCRPAYPKGRRRDGSDVRHRPIDGIGAEPFPCKRLHDYGAVCIVSPERRRRFELLPGEGGSAAVASRHPPDSTVWLS